MDAIELLEQDHVEVKGLFEQIRSAHEGGDEQRLAELAQQVMQELQVHSRIEEEILYPAIREADPSLDELVAESLQEHHVVDVLMGELAQLEPGEEFTAKVQVLMENTEHHVEEEEGDLFPKVRDALGDRLGELGAQLADRKQQLQRGAGDGGSQADGAGDQAGEGRTKDELYEQARELGVEGRSKMDKEELAEAVREAEG